MAFHDRYRGPVEWCVVTADCQTIYPKVGDLVRGVFGPGNWLLYSIVSEQGNSPVWTAFKLPMDERRAEYIDFDT